MTSGKAKYFFCVLTPSLALAAACGRGLPPGETTPTAPEPAPVTITAESRISGRITDGPDGQGVGGAMLSFGGRPALASAADGSYSLTSASETTGRLLIEAPGYLRRELDVRIGAPRALDLDLIANTSLEFYRRMARHGFEEPHGVASTPTRRWTQNPNIYIWTRWQDSGAPVRNVDFFAAEIRRVIPQLTGGTLEAGVIEAGDARRAPSDGWIIVQFDAAGNNAYVGANPGRVQFGSDNACMYQAITHEFGHAMGYWHNGVQPSVMGGGPGRCAPSDFTPDESRVARIMYARASGNMELDRDPDTGAAAFSLTARAATPPVLATCDRVLR